MTPDVPGRRVCDLAVGRRRGPLSLAERQRQRRYDEHLASCDDCRAMARLNAAVDPLGDVRSGDEAVVAAAADLALSRLGRVEAVGRRRALPGLMVVVLMLMGTSAGAGVVVARRQLVRLASTVAETLFPARRPLRRERRVAPRGHSSNLAPRGVAPVAQDPTADPASASASASAPELPVMVAAPATAPAPVALPAPPVAVAVAVAEPRRLRRPEVPAPRSADPSVGPKQVIATEPSEPSALNEVPVSVEGRTWPGGSAPAQGHGRSFAARPSPPPTAGALLASGTAARARGDRAAAVAFFRQLQIAYPGAKESEVALVSSGQLLLDGGDFSGALAAFRAYRVRAPAGPLVEEALDGAARALDGLGRPSEERAVWREMVARFPGSAYLPRATRRLRVLR